LSGIRVLDLSSVGPATRCTSVLADYGASVVKVGPPPSVTGVQIEPAFYAYSGHRGIERVQLDLRADGGRVAFLALAARADVIVESFRPGVVDRLGIGYEAVRSTNPGVIYCSTSGFGQDGPHAAWAGHDLDYLGVGGFLASSQPRGDGGPPIPGATVADSAAGGLHAALGVVAALAGRARTGEGTYLDVSVADGVLWLMSLAIDEHLATGSEPGPGHDILTGRYACYGTYEASDGKWLAVGAIEPKFYANLCGALGAQRWIDHQLDDEVQDEIRADFARAFSRRRRDEWVAELSGADTCVAPVLTVAEVVDDEQFAARQVVVQAVHPTAGALRQLAPLLAGMVRPDQPIELPDPVRTSSDRLLVDAGVDAQTVADWRAAGVVA
jgi:alpha-methylacyl-CoA racemase